jgi:ATP-dependent RNA helicase DDX46/PRP5
VIWIAFGLVCAL